MLPPCPKCGDSKNFVFLNGRSAGKVVLWYDNDGVNTEMDNDKTYVTSIGPIRCGKCGKVRKDLKLVESRIIPNLE